MAGKFCTDTNFETFWPPEMTRWERGRLNKKTAYINGERKEEEGRRQKKKTCRNCLDSELKCNSHIISHGQSSQFFAYHIRIILYPVPSFCSLWTADVFRVVASLSPKISEGEKRRQEIRLQFAG